MKRWVRRNSLTEKYVRGREQVRGKVRAVAVRECVQGSAGECGTIAKTFLLRRFLKIKNCFLLQPPKPFEKIFVSLKMRLFRAFLIYFDFYKRDCR